MNALVHYEEMRVAVERCARIDEAADLRDKAAALEAYARQRDDRDLEVWVSEIKLRASVRIGELVRELDTAPGERTDLTSSQRRDEVAPPTKAKALSDAGLSRSNAHRLEQLAGGRDQQAQVAGKAAADAYFAQRRQQREPATMDGLRHAVKEAVQATVGPPPERARPVRADSGADVSFGAFYASLRPLGELPFDADALVAAVEPELALHYAQVVSGAARLIGRFAEGLKQVGGGAPHG